MIHNGIVCEEGNDAHLALAFGIDEFLPKEQGEDLAGKELGQQTILELREMMKRALAIFTSLCHQAVEVRMKIYLKLRLLFLLFITRNDISG